MAWTEAEQAVADHLAAEPGPLLRVGPPNPGGWVASARSGGGQGADLATVWFRKTRIFPACQMHFVVFDTRAGRPRSAVLRTWRDPDGTWAVGPIGGGGGRDHTGAGPGSTSLLRSEPICSQRAAR